MARVRDDGSVLHGFEVFLAEHALVTGDSAEDVADLGSFVHAHHTVAIHHGFDRLRRVDFRDDDFGPESTCTAGETATAPPVTGDDELRSCQQIVGGANDSVDGRLARAVTIVEQVLGIGIVNGDDRIAEHALLRHSAQTDDTRSCFFRTGDDPVEDFLALGKRRSDQVRAVVHRDVRLVIKCRHDMRVVRLVVLALNGVRRNVVIAHQAGRDVVLRRKWIRSTKHNVGAAVAQGDSQVGSLGRNVQAGRNANALQRLVLDEFFADDLQNLHRLVGPVNALFAQIGKFNVGDVARCL